MERDTIRAGRIVSIIILLVLTVTAACQILAGSDRATDPDTVMMLVILLLIAIILFAAFWKYGNSRLQIGLALIIYVLGVDLVEEFARDFHFAETLLLGVILVAGFIILVSGVFAMIREIDANIASIRQQEAELRARSDELAATGAALERVNRNLRLLSQITRHDIGNRLLAASGFLALARNADQQAERERYLDRVARPLDAIREIIAFTKAYEEIGLVPPRWGKPRTLIESAAGQLRQEDVRIENAVDPGLEIFADAMIGKVFFNIIDNALAYGGPALTRIRFSTVADRDGILILCENNGEGIPAADKEQIFERGIGRHTGLGLFLAREILSMTGMTIQETGDPVNGVRFEIRVPAGAFRPADGESRH